MTDLVKYDMNTQDGHRKNSRAFNVNILALLAEKLQPGISSVLNWVGEHDDIPMADGDGDHESVDLVLRTREILEKMFSGITL